MALRTYCIAVSAALVIACFGVVAAAQPSELEESAAGTDLPATPGVIDESAPSDAEILPPVRAIVIDFQEIVRVSEAAASVRSQIDELRRAFQEEFSQIEDELRGAEQELAEGQTSLSPEEFNRARREFEQRITDAQRTAQIRRAALDQALDESMTEIRTALVRIVHDIAERNRANLVINQAEVILMGPRLDFNEEALRRLDEDLPFVRVNLTADP
jgi:Skp family chaperone for outer membrane proteins